MEQLFDAFGIDGKLLIAQLINFGVLFVALTWLLYKPVMKTLDERREKIAKGVEDAELATAKLEGADEEVSRRVQGAETEAEGIVASARDAANTEKARIMKEADARAAQIAVDADLRAKEAAAQALKESEKEVARLAVLAAEKVLRKS
ncbi:MAG: ATP synthase F0, B subunit [Parcubacteria bacterium C7867-004]|nr:MAG: ATP synthase F0, B subunit [Parcubacteria bacterium C7867-004]